MIHGFYVLFYTPLAVVLLAAAWILHVSGCSDVEDLVLTWIDSQPQGARGAWAAVVWLLIGWMLLQVTS